MREPTEFVREAENRLAEAAPGAFREVSTERRRRARRYLTPPVVTWSPPDGHEPIDGLTPAPGTVTLYWAKSSDGLAERMTAGFASGHLEQVADTFGAIAAEHVERELMDVGDAVGSLVAAPSFFDLRYQGSTLAQNLWLDGRTPLGSITLAYNGGRLVRGDFEVVEYPNPDNPEPRCPWDPWIVVSPPELSDLERRVLDVVPEDRTEINIAPSGTVMATPTALVTVAVFVTVNTAVTTCCGDFRDRLAEVSLSEDVLAESMPARSAGDLLELRAKVLEEFGVR